MASTENKSALGTITKIIFIGGAIVLFVLLAIWVIRLVPKAINGVANIGSSLTNGLRGAESIVVQTNDSEVNTGEPFVISFDYSPTVPGEYYFSFSCEEALVMNIESRNGSRRVLCNTPFKLGENIDMISLRPSLSRQNIFVDSEVTISYKDFENNEEIAYGNTIVTFKNTSGAEAENPYGGDFAGSTVTSTEVEEAPTTTNSSDSDNAGNRTYAPTYYGYADLAITNIARTVGKSELTFTVYNLGTNTSGNWYFSYTDAENPSNTLISPIQPNLRPGQGLLIRVGFDSQKNNNQTINVFADSTNSIYESNESNNYSSVNIDGNNNNSYNSGDDADLVIDNLEVGRISGSRFIENDEIDDNDDAAIRFTVRNIGGESTGTWRFEVNETPNDEDFRSSRQSSLRPGESIEFVIEFENPKKGDYNIEVEIDSDDDVNEENERNNDESERLRIR